MRFFLIIMVLCTSACASREPQRLGELPSGASLPEVHWSAPPWAYRIGPEIFATERGADRDRIQLELASRAASLGCDAVVSVVIPQGKNALDARPWGFCAYRVPATTRD